MTHDSLFTCVAAPAAALILVGATSLPPPFVASFTPGEALKYRYSVVLTGLSVNRTFRGQLSLSIKTVEPKVTGTEVRVIDAPAQRSTRQFELTPNGSVLFSGSSETAHNYFSFDARQYCNPPGPLSAGMSWNCTVPSAGMFHGGDARVRVVSSDRSGATLEVNGTGVDPATPERDPETGKSYIKRSSVTWHETVRFRAGLVESLMRRQTAHATMENLSLDTTIVTNINRT